jgi:predicted nucleic acid-binding protein
MLTYADGSALSRSLSDDAESVAWQRWFDANVDDVVSSPLGLTELRRAADPLGLPARERARVLAETVTVVRFFDQSLKSASMAASVLPSFAAIHLGIAVAHSDVDAIATYDELLARVAILYRLRVVAPGRPDSWWS